MWDIWRSGDYVGDQSPMTRITVQVPYVLEQDTAVSRWRHLFNQPEAPKELPNVASVEIDRGLDSDSASAKIRFYNTRPLALGTTPTDVSELDQPGYYTYNRGWGRFHDRWPGFVENEWSSMLIPDRVLRTYQGYGFDASVAPEKDPNLTQTGEWHIDEVTYSNDGNGGYFIECQCRDRAGPGLIDQLCFVPVVPLDEYPLLWGEVDATGAPGGVPNLPSVREDPIPGRWAADSNAPWVGAGNAVYGHRGVDAFDSNNQTYWLSIGNDAPNATYAFEWVQSSVARQRIAGVKFQPWAGNYRVYVSVSVNGAWQGSSTIPYDPGTVGAPNGANIPYVQQLTCGMDETVTVRFAQPYGEVDAVRLTFTNLYDSGLGANPYRAGVRTFTLLADVQPATAGGGSAAPGTPGDGSTDVPLKWDYSNLVKKLLCWGGFYWPAGATVLYSDGTSASETWSTPDHVVDGRVWGDIEMSGASPAVPLEAPTFDKKPLMDCIRYVLEVLGFIFFVDEQGGAVFRSPNMWEAGNFVSGGSGPAARSSFIPEIDERVNLTSINAVVSKRNSRYRVFVGNVDGQTGAAVDGREPYPVGWKRVAIWTDQHFLTKEECARMADLIAIRQRFTFRADTIQAQAIPAIQPDDQVQVFERVTGEAFLHYVRNVSTKFDMQTREYTMQLDTNWLGEYSFDGWWQPRTDVLGDTTAYLETMRAWGSGTPWMNGDVTP